MNKSGYFLAALLLALAVGLGLGVHVGFAQSFDRGLLAQLALHEGQSPQWLISVAKAGTWVGDSERRTIIALLAAAWLVWERRFRSALVVAVMPALGSAVASILKEVFARPRPHLAPHLDVVTNMSYPSGHSAAGAVFVLIALVLPGNQPRLRLAAGVAAMLFIGLSRPLLAVHWPTDVIGGWLVGLATAICAAAIISNWEKAR